MFFPYAQENDCGIPGMSGRQQKRAAVVGYGSIGRRHAANLLRMGFEVDVVSSSQIVAEAVGRLVPLSSIGPDTHAFAVLANRNDLHIPTAMELTGRGMDLMIEKPLSDQLEGAQELVQAVAENGTVCRMAFVLRQHPCLAHLRAVLDAGTYGKLYGVRTTLGSYLPNWRPGQDHTRTTSARSGVVLDMAHEFDYLDLLFGPFRTVQAQCGVVSDIGTVEDWADILYTTDRVMGSLHLDLLQRKSVRSTNVVLEAGTLELDLVGNTVLLHDGGGTTTLLRSGHDINELYLSMLASFVDAVSARDTGSNDLADGIRALRTALACRQASREMRTVRP